MSLPLSGLLHSLTPNILQQIRERDTVHVVILDQGFLIGFQYLKNQDHCQLHNVVPTKRVVLILVIKALPLRQKYNVNQSLKPILTYLSGTKNHFLRNDTSAKSLYLEHFHIVKT